MPDNDTTTQTPAERFSAALRLRREQGYSAEQIARAGGFEDTAQMDEAANRLTIDAISASELNQLMRAVFIDEGYLFTGTPTITYSPCSLDRLLREHYGQPDANTDPAPAPVQERFIPTWEELEKLWMDRMPYTSFVEKHEYELGFQVFKARHQG